MIHDQLNFPNNTMNKPFDIIFNPGSAMNRSARQRENILALLEKYSLPHHFWESRSEEHLLLLSREAAGRGNPVIAVGGDSTIFLVINEIIRHSMVTGTGLPAFGMLGTGSSNDIMKAHGVDSLEKSIEAVAGNKIRMVDLCRISIPGGPEFFFIGQANLGLGALVNEYVEEKKSRGYFIARYQGTIGLPAILRSFYHKDMPLSVRLSPGHPETEKQYISLLFTKIPYWISGKNFAPDAKPDDGKIHAVFIRKTGLFSLLRIILESAGGGHISRPEVESAAEEEYIVRSPRPFSIQVDGYLLRENQKKLMTREVRFSVFSRKLPLFGGVY